MQDINVVGLKGEHFIPWESTPAYTTLLTDHFNDHTNRISTVKIGEIEEEEAEKQTTISILHFIEKALNYLKLYNVRIVLSEDMNLESKLEQILSKIVHLQSLLIGGKA